MYMVEEAGKTVASRYAVGKADPKAIGALKPNKEKLSAAQIAAVPKKLCRQNSPLLRRKQEQCTILWFLVNFSDLAVAYPRQGYDDLFNQIGYTTDGAAGSVKDYYHQISYNALTVQSTVVEAVTLIMAMPIMAPMTPAVTIFVRGRWCSRPWQN